MVRRITAAVVGVDLLAEEAVEGAVVFELGQLGGLNDAG